MGNFLLIFAFLTLGALLARITAVPKEMSRLLNRFVIYVSLPAVVLLHLPGIHLDTSVVAVVIAPYLTALASALAVLLLGRFYRWSREVTGALLLVVPLGNTSFVGYPIIDAFYGKEGLGYAIVYDQLGTFILLASYGSIIAGLYGSGSAHPKVMLKKVLLFPPFIALIAGLLLMGVSFPPPVTSGLEVLELTLVPVAMTVVGYSLQFRIDRSHMRAFWSALGLKLLFMPLVALMLVLVMGPLDLPAQVAVLEAGMASMVTAGVLASVSGLAPRLVASLVGYGLIFSFATLGAWFGFLKLLS